MLEVRNSAQKNAEVSLELRTILAQVPGDFAAPSDRWLPNIRQRISTVATMAPNLSPESRSYLLEVVRASREIIHKQIALARLEGVASRSTEIILRLELWNFLVEWLDLLKVDLCR